MTNTNTQEIRPEAHEVPEHRRSASAAAAFGSAGFPFRVEPTIYAMADRLSEDYRGGFWTFYELSTGGFFMAPDTAKPFKAAWPDNYSEATVSAEAFGLVATLFACSHLSFGNDQTAERCAANYHLLLQFVYEHPEAAAILSLID